MFLILNKQKIYSYIIAVCTVVMLFFSASVLSDDNLETVQTSAIANNKLIPIYSVDTSEKELSLTMNCAWNADDIDSILATLDKYNVKITFFMVGEWVDKYPEVVKKISDAGHEIANHSDNHKHVNNLSYEENVKEIINCSNKIKEITGKETVLYRGPYGEYNNTVIKAANDNNHKMIQWSIDTLDYNGLDTEQIWDRLNNKIDNGSIVLMHNGTEHTAIALVKIIENIQQREFKIVPVSELIYSNNYVVDSNGVQKKN